MEQQPEVFTSSNGIHTYDVFLSFRGEDTRYGFTGNLYQALNQKGIKTFMDDEVIKRGQQISPTIFKAIQHSRIAIVVFSKTYASSKWCLQELVKIIACYRNNGLVVIPVFYKVDPSEVRNHTGNYGQQLAMHEEKMNEEVRSWRLALRDASNLAGWTFKDGYEYEYEFIKRIVDTVNNTSKQNVSHVDDHAVGLEMRVSNILFRLQMLDATVIMIGICGVGGIGKTTLARAVYDSIGQQFEGLCFLPDVRGNSTKYGLAYLQQVILYDTVGESIKLRNENEGISILIRKLQNKRILLILDDVDKLDQLKNLAGTPSWFGCGSRIIITTRRKDMLAAHGVGNIYDVPVFNFQEALVFLSSIASKRPNPDVEWDRAISYSRGLPLVLKIIGSDLLEKSPDEWEISLGRYEKVCNEETQSILEVSYNSLNELEKRIFTDIACFFAGEPFSYVKKVLSACGFVTKYGIESIDRLKNRSLISITPSGSLMVHDHIIDMAMSIVQQESPTNPCKRSRLWLPEDVLRVLDKTVENDKIEVMILDNLPQGSVEKLSDKAFKEMRSLRILIIKDAVYSEVLQHLPDSLRVLDWSGYPSCCLPTDFVNLPSSCLIFNKFKNMKSLISIDFSDCIYITEIPDMSGIANLGTLYLDNCINVTKIHDSVGFLDNLMELTATGCTNLETIPNAFELASLKVLSFSECPKLARFPEILCKIENLQHINLWQTGIKELPFSIGNVTGLEVLTLMDCTRLDKLPSSIFTLPRLQEIQADSCKRFGISTECEDYIGPVKFTVSRNKIRLYLSSCNLTDEHLFICLRGFANVVHLDLSYSNFTVLPPCIKECINLNTLLLTDCNQLQEISVIPPNLMDIDAVNCTSLTSQSQSVLLSQAFHEAGEKSVMLPGSSIPEWFDHRSSERSISFYARERFPSICVCVVFGVLEKLPHHFLVNVCLIINGRKTILSQCSSRSIVREHVWMFDLRNFIRRKETWLECGWNHVEISCEDCQDEHLMAEAVHGVRRITIVKWYGIHVYRQENNTMENVLFSSANTPQENNINDERFNGDNYPLSKRQCR